jgi:hypothetical protein
VCEILKNIFFLAAVSETTVKKTISYHHYAQYPSGWFLIRSFVSKDSTCPLVLTADSESNAIFLAPVDKTHWRKQLWMYWHGVLINFQTQLAIDVKGNVTLK